MKHQVLLDATPLDQKEDWNSDVSKYENRIDKKITQVTFTSLCEYHHLRDKYGYRPPQHRYRNKIQCSLRKDYGPVDDKNQRI